MTAPVYPPFPDDVPTHPLLIIDFALLKARDPQEIDRLWEAATTLGFWYLKNHGTDEEVNKMFDLGAEAMDLPLEEKLKFDQGTDGSSIGYKSLGCQAVDASGEKDTVEWWNFSQDDVLAWPSRVHRTYPEVVDRKIPTVIRPFVRRSLDVNGTIMSIFDEKLGLPKGTLEGFHPVEEHSGSQARIIKSQVVLHDAKKRALGAHTDFGSLAFLHNRLGGLQVLTSETWQYVKPLPGHAICNVGDALSIFSGGILHSNIHRVLPPPGAQSAFERYSLVFFSRPGNSKVLRALVEDSPIIAEAVNSKPEKSFETDSTAKDWFARRIRNQLLVNRKGPETWMASRGTEANPAVA